MDQSQLHQAMLEPAFYPEPTSSVGYKETHISRLYFTDQHVYKIKKPLNYGFLNFTSLKKRLAACNAEIELNRRFCSQTYLAVLPICRKKEHYAFGRKGTIIDYAVQMRRLPEERMLTHLLETRDQTLDSEIRRLASHLAALHGNAPSLYAKKEEENLVLVASNWDENLRQTAPFIDQNLSAEAQQLVQEYVTHFLVEGAEALREREKEGWVRDGHGDLHAEHICLTDPISIFDCIEFNRRFRVADLAADLAFLLMDLDYRNQRQLARQLLASYQDALGSELPTDLLNFYKIYRAWVRAKVNSFSGSDPTLAASERRAANTRARRYFNLALGYLCPPQMILLCGLMGVGKSTLAEELRLQLGGTLLRSDLLRKELAGIPALTRKRDNFGEGLYSAANNSATYQLMLEQSLTALQRGETVILDASFNRLQQRRRFRSQAAQLGASTSLIWLHCDQATSLKRMQRRTAAATDASDGRIELYARQQAEFELPLPAEEAIRINSEQDIEQNVEAILCQLLSRHGCTKWAKD
jgi:hypothetical protein